MKKFLLTVAALSVFGAGAVGCSDEKNIVERQEKKYQSQTQKKILKEIGFPKVDSSLELLNLKERYELLDDKNKVGYVYLIDHGLIFAEYTVRGKVSSLNSQFTNPERETGPRDSRVTIPQAEPDGSYGENPAGIFFWTTDKVYVEWGGNYQYSEQRLEIQQPAQNLITKQAK